jgi:hypothetical protein
MRLDRVAPGDVIKASIKGRTGIWGEVTEVRDSIVYFRPLCPATGWRHASAREIVGHWRKTGRRVADTEDSADMPSVASKEQLSLPGTHT